MLATKELQNAKIYTKLDEIQNEHWTLFHIKLFLLIPMDDSHVRQFNSKNSDIHNLYVFQTKLNQNEQCNFIGRIQKQKKQ